MNILSISGKARSGKDTFGIMVRDILQSKQNKVSIFHYGDLVKYICSKYLNWNGKKDEEGRNLLQTFGTDIVRKKDPNFWLNFGLSLFEIMDSDYWDYVIIPDCRFPNEIEGLKKHNHKVLTARIVRDKLTTEGDTVLLNEKLKQHASETALDDYEFDVVIFNNKTKENLKEEAINIAERMILLNEH